MLLPSRERVWASSVENKARNKIANKAENKARSKAGGNAMIVAVFDKGLSSVSLYD